MIRYYVCGIGYDKNECVTDYEQDFGDFDTYEEAYECFVKCQCKSVETFNMPYNTHSMLIQLEECEEDENLIECVNVRNEWWVINPNFKQIKAITTERLIQLAYDMLEWIGCDNDDMVNTLNHFNLTTEELREIGHYGYASMMED